MPLVKVIASKNFKKQLKSLPSHIKEAVSVWITSLKEYGMRETREIRGYRDKPLRGKRKGQRSVRLNRAYRIIYEEGSNKEITIVIILEVHKHEY